MTWRTIVRPVVYSLRNVCGAHNSLNCTSLYRTAYFKQGKAKVDVFNYLLCKESIQAGWSIVQQKSLNIFLHESDWDDPGRYEAILSQCHVHVVVIVHMNQYDAL